MLQYFSHTFREVNTPQTLGMAVASGGRGLCLFSATQVALHAWPFGLGLQRHSKLNGSSSIYAKAVKRHSSATSTGHINRALFTSHPNPKYFLFHPSHQIFRRMHGVLNVDKKDN
jgi:hypothetical protein